MKLLLNKNIDRYISFYLSFSTTVKTQAPSNTIGCSTRRHDIQENGAQQNVEVEIRPTEQYETSHTPLCLM
jgi:hypothetical protein